MPHTDRVENSLIRFFALSHLRSFTLPLFALLLFCCCRSFKKCVESGLLPDALFKKSDQGKISGTLFSLFRTQERISLYERTICPF